MAGEFDPAIQRLIEDIKELENGLREKQRMVNQLCKYAGRPEMYAIADGESSQTVGSIRPDQFYGKPLATAMREYLDMRGASQMGAATAREIFDALTRGGFKFDTKDEANAIRGMRQSLTKNSSTFHKLPNSTYGLREWYPGIKPGRNADDNGVTEKKSADDDEASSADSSTSSDDPNTSPEGPSEPQEKGG